MSFAPSPVGVLLRLILAATHTAQVVRLYTKARGKYVARAQQRRSIRCAQFRRRRLEAVGGGEEAGEEKVGIEERMSDMT